MTIRIAYIADYPLEDTDFKGPSSALTALVEGLLRTTPCELHIVTPRRKIAESIVRGPLDRLTVHYLKVPDLPVSFFRVLSRPILRGKILALDPDILHFQSPIYWGSLKDFVIPRVLTVHGLMSEEMKFMTPFRRVQSRVVVPAHERAFRGCPHLIAVSGYIARRMSAFRSAGVHQIPNAVRSAFFRVERAEIPGRLLCAGPVSRSKNPGAVLDVFLQTARQEPKASLHLAGRLRGRSYVRGLKRRLSENLSGSGAKFLGPLSPNRLAQEYAQASIFLHLSRADNVPCAIAEAMACGLPVVASAVGGIPEMVEDGETGFLTTPDDIGGAAEKTLLLLKDSGLRRRMGEKAKERAKGLWSPETIARRTFSLYEEMAKTPAGRASGFSWQAAAVDRT